MTDINYNPLQTDGFEFVEYTAPDTKGIAALKDLFVKLGFTEVAKHKSKEVWLYKQNGINFIINAETGGQAEAFAKDHGPSVCGMAWRVKDAQHAFEHAVENGAKPFQRTPGAVKQISQQFMGLAKACCTLLTTMKVWAFTQMISTSTTTGKRK